MSLPDQTPKLPKLPFLLADAVLLLAGWYIAAHGGSPLGANAIAAVTACVAVGALLGVIPFLTDYARKQDEALDERQRGLEALSRTINTAAEQISIAANGLNELTDLTHKNLKHAEQLPHKLQDKIAEFNAQLDNARQDDRDELEKEIIELRATETERLQAIAEKIHKAVGELTSLDATAQKHLKSRTELVERASETITKAQADSAIALADAVAAITRELSAAQTKALAEIDARLAERTALALAAISTAPVATPAPVASESSAAAAPIAVETPAEAAPDIASPPRKPRKARREESVPVEPVASEAPEVVTPQPPPAVEPAPAPEVVEAAAPAPTPVAEPPPVPLEQIQEIAPVAPASADPFVQPAPETAPAAADTPSDYPSPEAFAASLSETMPPAPDHPLAGDEPVTEPPPKKRSRKAAAEPGAASPLDPDHDELFTSASEDTQVSADSDERVISSDGATRLIATAYIGIGNRLFIRGDGPGLSWEKGVPLQFVSIGKWRWETADASLPIQFKLFKNDELECTGLGLRTLDPGHQQEVTAKF